MNMNRNLVKLAKSQLNKRSYHCMIGRLSANDNPAYIAYRGSEITHENDPFVCPSLKATGTGYPSVDPSWKPNDAYHPTFQTPFKHSGRVQAGVVAVLGGGTVATLFLYWFAQYKAGKF